MALRAASMTRSSPLPTPIPIRALPLSAITVFTSAKSRLISPGLVIKSVIPWTPWRRTLSASLSASRSGVFLSTISSKLLFEIIKSVSTCSRSSLIPSTAKVPRLLPSKPKGRVTTATVRAPTFLAIRAITGAAPVPDPPPIPAVMKTISAPCRASVRTSSLSSAALRPTSG